MGMSKSMFRGGCALVLGLLAAAGAHAQAALPQGQILQIGCNSNPNLFNTGYDAAGNKVLPNGQNEPTWEVSDMQPASNAALPPPPPANLTWRQPHVGNLAIGSWSNSPYTTSPAQWISREGSTSATGDWYYRVRFQLAPMVSTTTFKLGLDFMADNSVAEVFVNGARLSAQTGSGIPQAGTGPSSYSYTGFSAANRAKTVLTGPWLGNSAVNEVVVLVHSSNPYEGFLAAVSPTATCPVNQPQLLLTKTASVATAAPGSTVQYTVTATNGGTAAANGTVISDPLPTGLSNASWTCTPSMAGGATPVTAACGQASGTGNLNDTAAALPPDGVLTYTVTATVDAGPAGPLPNTASATPPAGSNALCAPSGSPPPCTASATVQRVVAELAVSKQASVGSAAAGQPVQYTLTVHNNGTGAADGTVVSDVLPADLQNASWTCTGSANAVCGALTGTGSVQDTVTSLPPGGSLSYVVSTTMGPGAGGAVDNTVSVQPPAGHLCAGGAAPPCTASATVQRLLGVLSVSKVASVSQAQPSEPISYAIEVRNTGNAPADGSVVSDVLPAELQNASWTCVASGGAVCGAASGTGNLQDTVPTLPAGGSLSYTLKATVGGANGQVHNTVNVTPGANGACASGAAAPCAATATVTVGDVMPVPTLHTWVLLALGLLLCSAAGLQLRQGRH